MTATRPPARDVVLGQLDGVLSSATFRDAERSRTMLRFLVERTLDGQGDRLKEYTVGAEALNRGVAFDPRTDPIVRAEASRLRTRLDKYYATDGAADAIVIELPKGTYVPTFQTRLTTPERWRPRWRPIVWITGGSLATVGAFATGAWVARPSPSATAQPLLSYDVHLQSSGVVGSEVGTDMAISDDASRIVYVATDSAGNTRLRVRSFDGSPARELPGTDGARGPFLSPDGQWVGFWAGGQVKKTSLGGGSPVVLAPASDLLGASWGDDGTIVASLGRAGQLWRLSSAGGPAMTALDLNADGATPAWPQLLPGKRVLYTALTLAGADRATIEVASLADGRRTVLVKGGTFGRFVAPGYLTYVNQGTLYAVRFDLDRLETRGSAIPVLDDVAYSSAFGYAQVVCAANGVLAYRRQRAASVVMLDSAGHHTPLIDAPGRYLWPAVSPDGRRLAITVTESGVLSTSIFDISNGRATRVAAPTPDFGMSAWTRNGNFLTGTSPKGLAWVPASGGPARILLAFNGPTAPWSVAPDGRLAFSVNAPGTALDLWTVPLTESDSGLRAGVAAPLLATRFYEAYPTYSPDGRWLAFTSNESGSWEIYVRPIADSTTKVQVSRGGGRVPRWSRARSELFYATDDQRLMVATYTVRSGVFVARAPRAWTTERFAETGVFPNYDLAADGRSVIALIPPKAGDAAPPVNHVTLVFNFAHELGRRFP